MTGHTARFNLPYAQPGDSVDYPRDQKALADAVDTIRLSPKLSFAGNPLWGAGPIAGDVPYHIIERGSQVTNVYGQARATVTMSPRGYGVVNITAVTPSKGYAFTVQYEGCDVNGVTFYVYDVITGQPLISQAISYVAHIIGWGAP